MFCRAETGTRFSKFVGLTFAFGWLAGLVIVFKLWQLADAPRWLMFSGTGYVSLMLAPPLLGFVCTRTMGWLAGRGFAGAPLGLAALGFAGLILGFCAL